MIKNNLPIHITIFLIDGNAYVHRAYHALPPLTTFSGLPINAVYGFVRMIFKILKNFKPEFLCICFDSGKPTFRHQMFKEYKATRKELEDSLKLQFPIVYEFTKLSGIPYLIIDEYEADDVISCIAKKFEKNYKIVVVSGDKDVLQLVNENIIVYNEHKDIWYDREKVKEKYGVYPELLVDYFVLIGDKIDNIPGIEGIGPKTAEILINKFGGLEQIFNNIDKLEPNKKEKFLKSKEGIFESRNLIKLYSDIKELKNFDITKLKLSQINFDGIKNFIIKYDMRSLLKELDNLKNLFNNEGMTKNTEELLLFENIKNEGKKIEKKDIEYVYVNSGESFDRIFEKIKTCENLLFGIISQNLVSEYKSQKLIGLIGIINVNKNDETKFYFPQFQHRTLENTTLEVLNNEIFAKFIKDVFSLQKIIITYDIKSQIKLLLNYSETLDLSTLQISNLYDLLILLYLINPNRKISSLQELVNIHLGNKPISELSLPVELNLNIFPVEKILSKLFDTLNVIYEIFKKIEEKLIEFDLIKVYKDVELPLLKLLIKMEKTGILVDRNYIDSLKYEIENNLKEIKQKIIELAGLEINLNSPKQLAFLLFEKLRLPPIKKKKTGYSTDEEVLLKLKDIHPIIPLILKHRELEKLKNTYLEPLTNYINPKTLRIHTNFNLVGTSTGRLSSEEPNLQNIPVKTDWGKRIRNIFIAEKTYKFVSFDYSQIELRILSHFSNDKNLQKAFFENKDVHKMTASEIFGISEDKVDDKLRSIAKVINFGIVYGMSAQGLANELNIPIDFAQQYINKYFENYADVKRWIEETIKFAKLKGYVKTLLGRIRPIQEINSSNKHLSAFGERLAINTPIQGSAADIINLAMVKIYELINRENLNNDVRMLLQIHDELLFEIREDFLEKTIIKIKDIVENVVKLKVPLVVNINISSRWGEKEN